MIDSKTQEKLRKEHNPEGSSLRKLQLRMLEILLAVDAICKKHDIKYWLSSGTLLGAVRHGGFIPWDDDLDIEMLREDYIKLINILPKELPKQFTLQTDETDLNYISFYAKVRDKCSYVHETIPQMRILKHQGAFIDIFPLEPACELTHRLSVIFFNLYSWNLVLKTGFQKETYKMLHLIQKYIINPVLRFFSIFASKNILYHSMGVYFNSKRTKDTIFPLKTIAFEGLMFPCPNNIDLYLTNLYGDYKKIPENIVPHSEFSKIRIW